MDFIKKLFGIKPKKSPPRVVQVRLATDRFIAIKDDKETENIKWSEIEIAYTYKVDCFAYDMIWLAFVRQEGELHVPEEAEGFEILMAAMSEAIPEINSNWYDEVMQSPFAENFTILFQRKT